MTEPEQLPTNRQIAVIANPAAGRGRGAKVLPRLERALLEAGDRVEVFLTQKAGDAEDAARRLAKNCDLVVVVGGDGTVGEVLNGLGDRAVPLGLVPLGTSNSGARELGLPVNAASAIRNLREGKSRRLDLGTAAGRRFYVGLSCGPDAWVVRQVGAGRAGKITYFDYVRPTLQLLTRYDWPRIRVVADGQEQPPGCRAAIICNTRVYGGRLVAAPQARPDDSWLDACLFYPPFPRLWLPFYLFGMAFFRLHARLKSVRFLRGRRFELSPAAAEKPVPLQLDGESVGFLPCRVEVLPQAASFLVP